MKMGKRTKRKSRAIALGLAEALHMVEQIHRQGGGGEVPRNSLESIINSKPTSSLYNRKLSALKSYGLIEIHGEMISLSPLGKTYATPTSPDERKQAALQAFRKISLFNGLLDRFEGKPLPEINEFFRNLVAESFQVPHEEVPKWIEEFVDGAKFTGILSSEGGREVIRLPSSIGAPSTETSVAVPTIESEEWQEQQKEVVSIKISGGKTQINIPDKIDPELLKETYFATDDALEMMRRKYKRLTGEDIVPTEKH